MGGMAEQKTDASLKAPSKGQLSLTHETKDASLARARTVQQDGQRPLPGMTPQPVPAPSPVFAGTARTWPAAVSIPRQASLLDGLEPALTLETAPALAYARTGGDLPAELAAVIDVLRRNRAITWEAVADEMSAVSRAHLSNARNGTFGLSPTYAHGVVAWVFAELGPPEPDPPDPETVTPEANEGKENGRSSARPAPRPADGDDGRQPSARGAPAGGRVFLSDGHMRAG